ncbi:MAG: efflux RND transporter periplasmic adaptor subunit [Pseudomonadota bacterium]
MNAPTPTLMRRLHPLLLLLAAAILSGCGAKNDTDAKTVPASKSALTVEWVTPAHADWPLTLAANGDIAAWQEAVIGVETGNARLVEVRANVGDRVRKGQTLALIDSDTVAAELAQSRAAAAEAEAALAEAQANAERARRLQASGFYSAQMGSQYLTGAQTAQARLDLARARVRADEIRLAKTRILAPDDGVISARNAAVGSFAQPGDELFRLIRGGRLEWRAKVAEAELGRIAPGTGAVLTLPDGAALHGRVRAIAPRIDPASRDGMIYVDLDDAAGGKARAGMFAQGVFELGKRPALTLPQGAVVLRDGFAYVYRLEGLGADGRGKAVQAKVELGRRLGERVEITAGLAADARVVAAGAGFLADGDLVTATAGAGK